MSTVTTIDPPAVKKRGRPKKVVAEDAGTIATPQQPLGVKMASTVAMNDRVDTRLDASHAASYSASRLETLSWSTRGFEGDNDLGAPFVMLCDTVLRRCGGNDFGGESLTWGVEGRISASACSNGPIQAGVSVKDAGHCVLTDETASVLMLFSVLRFVSMALADVVDLIATEDESMERAAWSFIATVL